MKASFVVPGEPQGKARPRFSRRGGTVATYTPQKTIDYERDVVTAYKRRCGGVYFGAKIPLSVSIDAYFKPPKSTPKAILRSMHEGSVRPAKKPDADNIAKAICDALNGTAYHDDAQIVDVAVHKLYADTPRVEVSIEAM